MLYVNKKTTLVDTRNCSPSYHQLKAGEKGTLPETQYEFSHLEDVTRYWFQVYTVCMETPLGMLSASAGVEITLVRSEKKPEMVAALEARTGAEAEAADDGALPGDGLGAAGFDSSLFAHLKRNWSWNGKQGQKQIKADTPAAEAAKRKNTEGKVKVTQELLERKGKRRKIVKRKADEEESSKTIESIPFKVGKMLLMSNYRY